MLLLAPSDVLKTLEFDKILELIQEYSLGDLGKQAIAATQLHTEPHTIERLLLEAEEMQKTYLENHNFPVAAYNDISEDLHKLQIEGYVLPLESFQDVRRLLAITRNIFSFFGYGKKREIIELYPTLFSIIKNIEFVEALELAIGKVLDEDGNLRPDASPELQRLARLQSSKRQELDKRFRSIVQQYVAKDWLADIVESFRNGRRVLAVLAEHKRQVRGIIHDESATGKTAFIEPEEVIDLNNDLFDLEQEEKREIYRILRDLSAVLSPYAATMQLYQDTLVRYDVIQAKARLSYAYNGQKPKLMTKPHFKLSGAYHPLLYLKNKKLGQKVRFFDLHFRNDARILLLSGPNAGGKSICMKAVGLLQLMTQAGLLIPVEEGSEIGVFTKIFGDIGDQQSLEDELSTYSSRLRNAREFIDLADKNTLVLIDEFGSGTDPKMGGAIAEAILRELNFKHVWGVITTHYTNLKLFAHENKGLVNGAMVFDRETLSPTYEMRIGKPGSSYAFEIAQKSGLPRHVIGYAQHQVGKQTHDFDGLLVELQQERQKVQEASEQLLEQQKRLDQLIKNYEFAHRELEFGRKKLKLQAKEQELQDTREAHSKALKELQQAVQDIRRAETAHKAAELAKQAVKKTDEHRAQLSTHVENIKEDIYKVYEKTLTAEIKVGGHVKLRDGSSTGIVREIRKKEAVVEVGNLTLTIPLRDLQGIENFIETNDQIGVRVDTIRKQANFEGKLDIRGLRHEEAMEILQTFMDEALLSNAHELRIVHGKGSGALRRAVLQKLREYPTIKDIRHPEPNQGGDGVTIVDL